MTISAISTWIPAAWPEALAEQIQEAFAKGSQVAARKAAQAIADLPREEQGRPFKLALCGTFTIQPLAEFVRLALAVLPTQPTLLFGDLDNIEQQLLDSESDIHAAHPDAIVVLWRLEEIAPALLERPWALSNAERQAAAEAVEERLTFLVKSYAERFSVPLYISSLPRSATPGRRFVDTHAQNGIESIRLRLNLAILDVAAQFKCCHAFDLSEWADQRGASAWDHRMDMFARQPIASAAVPDFAATMARMLAPLVKPSRKVLVLDLDNTLWGGILGEDGVAGLKIGHDYPGKVYRRIQLAALALKDQGILLALVSKNNHGDVVQAFEELPDMPIRLNDFSAIRINWNAKSTNIADIASELNLGLDSVVFVDDMAFEREEVACTLPSVAVLDTTEDPLAILGAIANCLYFDTYRITDEDRLRGEDYANQRARNDLQKSSGTVEDYLRTLSLKAEIRPVEPAGVGRVVQMLAKTNQFNVTTRRHSEADVFRMLEDGNSLLLTLSLRDRFGDQGVVGLAIAIFAPDRTADIDTLLLSCRALGRGAEDVLWASLLARLSGLGITMVRATYIPNGRNMQCNRLFERFGMTPDLSNEHGNGAANGGGIISSQSYFLALPAELEVPDWLLVTEY